MYICIIQFHYFHFPGDIVDENLMTKLLASCVGKNNMRGYYTSLHRKYIELYDNDVDKIKKELVKVSTLSSYCLKIICALYKIMILNISFI